MRDRAELQAWMRGGCPVPEPGSEPVELCDLFFLTVDRWDGEIAATCSTCSARQVADGVKVQSAGGAMLSGGDVIGHNNALGKLEGWMVLHAEDSGLAADAAEAAFGSSVDWRRVMLWAEDMMRGSRVSQHSGWISPEGVPLDAERGVWLVALPGHEGAAGTCPKETGYHLQAWPDEGVLTARCGQCSRRVGAKMGDDAEPHRFLQCLWQAVQALGEWMDSHAGHWQGTAWATLARPRAHNLAVAGWAEALLVGREHKGENVMAGPGFEYTYTLSRLPTRDRRSMAAVKMLPVPAPKS